MSEKTSVAEIAEDEIVEALEYGLSLFAQRYANGALMQVDEHDNSRNLDGYLLIAGAISGIDTLNEAKSRAKNGISTNAEKMKIVKLVLDASPCPLDSDTFDFNV